MVIERRLFDSGEIRLGGNSSLLAYVGAYSQEDKEIMLQFLLVEQ
jgi:hypothetical protein